jgi:acetyl-CoA C-acetyltransferase
VSIDPRAPCIVGVARHTWRGNDAPEPLAMWEHVARAAADDAPARLAARVGADPKHRFYSGIGGTTPQQLIDATAAVMARGNCDLALVTSAEALATQRAHKQRGERAPYSFPPAEKRPFPWEAPLHPAEIAHEVFQAWLTFALFDNARRAALGVGLDEYRARIGALMAPLTDVAAANADAWFPVARTPDELVTPTATNRMVGYPYTKYVVSVMDVDMAAAVILATHEKADALGVPREQRVYLRGSSYATDPTYVAEHDDHASSPAMRAAGRAALARAGATVDDVAHLDLYSCFPSSLHFACDALGVAPDDPRGLTVTGGLPYHGGPGSGYLTHAIATMAGVLRADDGSLGLVSGVGMHMTKHVFGVYSTTPPERTDAPGAPGAAVDSRARAVVDEYTGDATVAAYSVVHGRDGAPEWGLLVCDVAGGARAYAKLLDAAELAGAERDELVGAPVRLAASRRSGPMGEVTVNVARRCD